MGLNWIETLHRQVGKLVSGTRIWEREADIYCILDGCRVDTFRALADSDADAYWSVGASSPEWIRRTFDGDMESVGYITGNPFSDRETDCEFGYFHQAPVQQTEHGIETVPPHELAHHAATIWNEREQFGVDTLVVHFMQPHVPFRSRPEWFNRFCGSEVWGSNLWYRVANGEINKDEWFGAYADNLRWVWREGVQELAETVDATLGVTADHGNACGEWGISGHPSGVAVPSVRKVPWTAIEAKKEREPPAVSVEPGELDQQDREEQLRALGYR